MPYFVLCRRYEVYVSQNIKLLSRIWFYSACQGLNNLLCDGLYHKERANFIRLTDRFSETFETWPNLAVEMAPTGVTESDA